MKCFFRFWKHFQFKFQLVIQSENVSLLEKQYVFHSAKAGSCKIALLFNHSCASDTLQRR